MNDNPNGRGKMDSEGGAVAEDAALPRMADADAPALAAAGTTGPTKTLMTEPAPSPDESEATSQYPDMQPPDGHAPPPASAASYEAARYGDAYLRLVVRVDHGTMSVRSASVVGGPLVEPELTGQMVYEVLLHGRRIAAGAFDDLSWQHGVAPPDDEQRGHSHTELKVYDFVVRIPREDVTLDELEHLEIRLVRPVITTQLSADLPSAEGRSFASAATAAGQAEPATVATLHGVDIGDLETRSAESLRSTLR